MSKKNYINNIRYVYILSLSADLVFVSALVVPFFLSRGLNQAKIMALQTIFSVLVVLLEVPTGYVADRYGRVVSLRSGALLSSIGLLGYAFSETFLQFVLCEVVLAFGLTLISGADEALLYDSLKVEGREKDYRHVTSRMRSYEFLIIALGAPIGSALASRVGIPPILFLDGTLTFLGFLATLRLIEPPLSKRDSEGRHPIADMSSVVKYSLREHNALPSLIVLGAALSASTYFGFWLAPAILGNLGISLVWFGVVASLRSVLKAFLSSRQKLVQAHLTDKKQLSLYAFLAVFSYIVLALIAHPFALIFLFGFDIVQSLQSAVIMSKVQQHVQSQIRAQVLSVMSLARRGLYAVTGPLIGYLVDRSLRIGLLFSAVLFGGLFHLSLKKLLKNRMLD